MDAQYHLHGRLEDVHFPDLLLEISQRRETGILHLTRQNIEKDIYIQDGRIVFAKSNDPDERLGELLLRRGKISLPQLVESASKIVPGVRLGTILVQEGFLKAGELYQGVIDQVEEIIYSVFEWSDGTYQFQPGELPSKEVITLSISTPDIINIGISRIWRWSWIRKAVGQLDTVYMRRREWNAIAKKMLITPALQSLIDMLEEPKKLDTILAATRGNSYETCKLLWALLSIGLIEKIPSFAFPEEEPPAEQPAPIAAAVQEQPAEPVHPESLPTQIIPWTPRKLPPMPPQENPPPVAQAVATMAVVDPVAGTIADPVGTIPQISLEPGNAPTVEISFSDLAEFTDQQPIPAPPVPAEPERPVEVPEAQIQKRITSFNELHRYMFEMLRIEMGAGVANFISKALKKALDKHPLVYAGVRVNEYGELDSDTLLGNIQGNLVDEYESIFDWLLTEERTTVAAFLDKKRLDVLETGLQKIIERQREAQ